MPNPNDIRVCVTLLNSGAATEEQAAEAIARIDAAFAILVADSMTSPQIVNTLSTTKKYKAQLPAREAFCVAARAAFHARVDEDLDRLC